MPGVIAAPLRNPQARRRMGFPDAEDQPMPVMAEVNLRFGGGRSARVRPARRPVGPGHRRPAAPTRSPASTPPASCRCGEVERLVAADAAPVAWRGRSIYRMWPDFPVQLHVDASCVTVKADAARRSFNAFGDDIVWAVVDTGIAQDHPHFAAYHTLDHPDVADLHRDFTGDGEPDPRRRVGRRGRARHARGRHHRRGDRAVAGREPGPANRARHREPAQPREPAASR